MKILRSLGNEDAIVDSASRLVVMYRLGSIGAPAAAEMKTKEGTFWKDASWARVIAGKTLVDARLFSSNGYPHTRVSIHKFIS